MTSVRNDKAMGHRARALAVFGLALVLAASLVFDAGAAVSLISFTATPQSDGSILVAWETGSELDTIAFSLFRSDSAGGHGDQPVDRQPAQGDRATGGRYKYKDVNITPGVRYYYYLEEMTQSGSGQKFGPVNAGVGLATEPTATVTATPTAPAEAGATATVTAAAPPGSTATMTVPPAAPASGTATATATQTRSREEPTATRAYTNTPQPNATATGRPAVVPPGALPGASPGAPSATPAPGAPGAVTTPSGGPPAATAPVGANTTPLPTNPPAGAAPSPSPQFETTGAPAEAAAPTPRVTQPPRIFESAATVLPAGGTPQRPSSQAAAPSADGAERNTRLVLFLGGGAIGLAVVLGAAAVLIWRARSR